MYDKYILQHSKVHLWSDITFFNANGKVEMTVSLMSFR